MKLIEANILLTIIIKTNDKSYEINWSSINRTK